MIVHRAKRIALPLLAAATLACGGATGTGSTAGTSTGGTTAPADGNTVTSPVGTVADTSTFVAYEPMPPDTGAAPMPIPVAPIAVAPGADAGTPAAPIAGTPSAPAAASGIGVFTVSMVDAPNPHVDELWVIVESVTVHVAGQGWVKLQGVSSVYVDLLKLKSTDTAVKLGFLNLPAGTITQIRLLIGHDESNGAGGYTRWNHVKLADGNEVTLKVPSGFQTGVKIIGPWTIAACTQTDVTIDFDGHKSIWYHPNGHETEWILRPVIRVRGAITGPITCPDPATDGVTPPPGVITPPSDPVIVTPPSDPVIVTPPSGDGTTGGSTTPGTKANGDTCSAPTECASGSCVGSVCTASGTDGGSTGGTTGGTTGDTTGSTPPPTKSFGESCTAPTECTSSSCVNNTCSASGYGVTCQHDAECISNLCYQSSCALSPQGGACTVASDCSTNVCSGGTCGAGSKLPVDATCYLPAECASNECSGTGGTAGTCQPGFQGAPCTKYEDCATGLRCAVDPGLDTGTCQPPGPSL